jgi:hypothetical protein
MSIDTKEYIKLSEVPQSSQNAHLAYKISSSAFNKVLGSKASDYDCDSQPSLKLPSDLKIRTSEISQNLTLDQKVEDCFDKMCDDLSDAFSALKCQSASPFFFAHPFDNTGKIYFNVWQLLYTNILTFLPIFITNT